MDSPRTSEPSWYFVDDEGARISVPQEWSTAFIAVDVPPEDWDRVAARIQGVPHQPQVRRVGLSGMVVIPWERSGAGRYRVSIERGTQTAE